MNTVTTMNTAIKPASVSLVVDNTKPLTMSDPTHVIWTQA